MRRAALAILFGTAATPAHADPRPARWLGPAVPGFGYGWDGGLACSMDGRMFVGGFAVAHEVSTGIFVGGATTITFNTLLADAPCGLESGTRLAMGIVLGPEVEWYPLATSTLHASLVAGWANLIPDNRDDMSTSNGLGATLAVGYEWIVAQGPKASLRIGVRAEVTAQRTWSGPYDHTIYVPSLVSSFSVGLL
jgi:hypothetical protein